LKISSTSWRAVDPAICLIRGRKLYAEFLEWSRPSGTSPSKFDKSNNSYFLRRCNLVESGH
jgi:hypothetical protein